jgi:hypothetical protein
LVGGFVWAPIILSGRSYKPEVHEEFTAALGKAFGRLPCRLLTDVGLFFEVDMLEWVVFKNRRDPINVFGEGVELAFSRRTET